jgi:hypothetical protein
MITLSTAKTKQNLLIEPSTWKIPKDELAKKDVLMSLIS